VSRKRRSRRRAREIVLRILYEAEVRGRSIPDTVTAVLGDSSADDPTAAYARAVTSAVAENRAEIDARVGQAAERWTIERMSMIDRNVLRLATAELMVLLEVDAPVVIDEAVSIAHEFGTDSSGSFVNGVLDRIARDTRPHEVRGE